MPHPGHLRPHNGYGGYDSHSGSGSSDGFAHSSSSIDSKGRSTVPRPVIRHYPPSVNHAKMPQPHTIHGNDGPYVQRESPSCERSTFTLNGQHINETHKPRLSSVNRPANSLTPLPPANMIDCPPQTDTRYVSARPIIRYDQSRWASEQESKVKIIGLPRACWTNDIYHALSKFGTVVRIQMVDIDNWSNSAFVIFQPPASYLPSPLLIGGAAVRYELQPASISTVPSPMSPAIQYLETNALVANSLTFGVQTGDRTLLSMQRVNAIKGIYLTLNLKRKELKVQFPLKIDQESHNFHFELPISQLSQIHLSRDPASSSSITIPFTRPPRFFVEKKRTSKDGGSFPRKERTWHVWSTQFRETDIVNGHRKGEMESMPLTKTGGSAIIDIGYWTTYRLTFPHQALTGPKFDEFCNALGDFGVTVRESDFTVTEKRPLALSDMLEEEYTLPKVSTKLAQEASMSLKDLTSDHIHLPFPVRYQLEACLSNSYIRESSLTREFLEKLKSMDMAEAVHVLEKVVDKQHIHYDPMTIFSTPHKVLSQRSIPRHCVMQRSVNITPTMMHVASPVMEISNRITRQNSANADRFIRVKFSDEKGEGALRNMPNGRADALFDRVSRAMRNGIVVAGRHYHFLAFGNSQFREHGAYFYAPTSHKSADSIRQDLGQFEHIRTVAKYGARLGQCFSTTRAMQNTVAIKKIPDIERNGYTFTDGVGKLSFFLAQMAAQDLGLHFENPPSLFQFRLGGCKGVLALDRAVPRNEVHIRPSQYKFEAPYTGLEIIRCSSLATPFLNRQIIVVLSDLGVRDGVFIRRQQHMVNSYERAMTDKNEALKCLLKHIDMNQSTLMMASMVKDGFLESREPFMMSLLNLWRATTIKDLKKKARIAIDEGAFVLGCVDESGTLQGHRDEPQSRLDATREEKMKTLPEIFVQIDDTSRKGCHKIIEGVCLLARNPSLHPGDIRVVRAVNVPALHHHKNVVVLPQTGDRDLANMCSGGDLDGDDFMVLWDQDMIPEIVNHPAMDFTPDKPKEKDGPIDIAEVCDFFVTYMKNDSLGQIAHAHLAHADSQVDGVFSGPCLALANLHSQAVDYPKSGIPAAMEDTLRPKTWPHFMEKKYKLPSQVYKSKNVLGMLYDQVQLVDFKPNWTFEFDQRILDKFSLDEALFKTAAEVKANYDSDLKRLMAKHGIQTEFEAFSIFVLDHNNESRDYKFAEEFGCTVGILKAQYREACLVASGATSTDDWDRLGPFVAAMYSVTAGEVKDALENCNSAHMVGTGETKAENMPFMSFPWLFHTKLGKLATGNTPKPHTDIAPHYRQYKQRANNTSTAEPGVVQTDEGITRLGEILNLNFEEL
ncbi:hypothetical protein E8E13_005112 [Curvularia kusanoi]|uniref:RNA-dependent RNA polymerase n=1 Tax=Curvularia kusanoi TaxID=90978 RepID=A0A9P4T8P4_CURKU|nr:hypothetical protein E8E13_005112 [Curvularia kusanoi]